MNFEFAVKQNHSQNEKNSEVKAHNQTSIEKTKLTKKYTLGGFRLCDLVWMRPADGRHKFEVLVRYIDPEEPKTKRDEGAYQKVIKFGQKGVNDFVDLPHMNSTRDKVLQRLKVNCENPLHPNFYVKNVLNGTSIDAYENFKLLKRNIFC